MRDTITHMKHRDANAKHTELFEKMLKEGIDLNPATSTDPKDEERSTVGTSSTYENPEDRESGNIDAPWGEHDVPKGDARGDAVHHGTGVEAGAHDTKQGVLERSFSGFGAAEKAEHAMLTANFARGTSGDFQARAPLLQNKSKAMKVRHQRQPTLMKKVKEVAGRY